MKKHFMRYLTAFLLYHLMAMAFYFLQNIEIKPSFQELDSYMISERNLQQVRDIHVNQPTNSSQILPRVAALEDGGFVITWQSLYQDGSEYGIYAQIYNANGTIRA